MCFLHQGAEVATPHAQQVLDTGALDSLLLSDLATDVYAGPEVDDGHVQGERAEDTAVTDRLSVLPEGVAGAEIRDDTGSAVVEAPADSVTPFTRHDFAGY